VLAELPRPWRRIMVCVWGCVGRCVDEDEVWAMVGLRSKVRRICDFFLDTKLNEGGLLEICEMS
jgi:hypothetical protein